MRLLALLIALATPATAQEQMTFEEFEAYVTGSTYTWARPALQPYGVETYHEGRRVLWTIFGQDCKEGIYYPGPDNQVCFEYPATDTRQCWIFFERNGSLRGVSLAGTPVDLRQSYLTAPCIEEFLGS